MSDPRERDDFALAIDWAERVLAASQGGDIVSDGLLATARVIRRLRAGKLTRPISVRAATESLFDAGARRKLTAMRYMVGSATFEELRYDAKTLKLAAIQFTAAVIGSRSAGEHDREPLELAERVLAAMTFVEEAYADER